MKKPCAVAVGEWHHCSGRGIVIDRTRLKNGKNKKNENRKSSENQNRKNCYFNHKTSVIFKLGVSTFVMRYETRPKVHN